MTSYATIKKTILGHGWDMDGDATKTDKGWDCVDVAKKMAQMYFPGKSFIELGIHGNGNQIFHNANPKYWQKIENDEHNANQLPKPGDIMCFDATPWPGYTNQFKNPYGHVGGCDSANTSGYTLLMQESYSNLPAFLQYKSWKFRHCQGWLRPIAPAAPKPAPKPVAKPVESATDQKQDAELKTQAAQIASIQALLNKVVSFLTAVFSGFKK